MLTTETSANVESKKKIKNSKKFNFWIFNEGSTNKTRRALSPKIKNFRLFVLLSTEKTEEKEFISKFKKHKKKTQMQRRKKLCCATSFSTKGKLFFNFTIVAPLESNKKIIQLVRKISVKKKLRLIVSVKGTNLLHHQEFVDLFPVFMTARENFKFGRASCFGFKNNGYRQNGIFRSEPWTKLKIFNFTRFRQ